MAQSITPGFEKNKATGKARTDRLVEIARLAQNEMKALLEELRGPADEDQGSLAAYARRDGLANALEHHCNLAAPEDANVTFNIEDESGFSDSLKETLLRISQEALANAFRHGGAKTVSISRRQKAGELCFRIEDDGRGLQPETAPDNTTTRIGIASMRARAARAGGQLTVENRAGAGVRVELHAPLH